MIFHIVQLSLCSHERKASMHNGCFWRFLFKKYLRQISNTNQKISEKIFFIVSLSFNIEITRGPLIFIFFTCWYLQLEFFSNSFCSKVPRSSQCAKLDRNLYRAAFHFSLKWWSCKYYENLPVEQVYMGLLFW